MGSCNTAEQAEYFKEVNMVQVKFENISMSFGDNKVLDTIDFIIPEGKLVSILGPSGCGKSTTLMLISGLTFPTGGNIYFGDKNVTKKDAVNRKVGMVFQNYALYPHLTVLENVMFPLKMAKVSKSDRKERAMELIDLVQITDHVDKKPKQLSGGQQQRVAIARALAKKPSILLMDEPLSNLDARLRIEMREEIRRIQQETGVTTVFVTHDQEEALSISDEVMVLNDGSIQQYSNPIDLYRNPSNKFVAKFIGTPVINTVDRSDINDAFFKHHAFNQDMVKEITQVGLRSEDLYVTSDSNYIVQAEVQHVERVGKDTTVHLSYQDQNLVATDLDLVPDSGELIKLKTDPEKVHAFNDKDQTINILGGGQNS